MKRWTWIVFLLLGILILIFSSYNAVYIPALNPTHPDQGWAWLTTDPEIIDYIKFNFRVQGLWQFAYGLLVMATAVGGFRQGERWAWIGLCSVPSVLAIMALMMPWTAPILIIPIAAAVAALVVSLGQLNTKISTETG